MMKYLFRHTGSKNEVSEGTLPANTVLEHMASRMIDIKGVQICAFFDDEFKTVALQLDTTGRYPRALEWSYVEMPAESKEEAFQLMKTYPTYVYLIHRLELLEYDVHKLFRDTQPREYD